MSIGWFIFNVFAEDEMYPLQYSNYSRMRFWRKEDAEAVLKLIVLNNLLPSPSIGQRVFKWFRQTYGRNDINRTRLFHHA